MAAGVPARPDPPGVGTGDPVTVTLTTQHSGVRDSSTDNFHFIVEVEREQYTQYSLVFDVDCL